MKEEMTYLEKLEIRRNPPRIMTVPEAAIYIGVSNRKIRHMIADSEIRVVRMGGRVAITVATIDAFIECCIVA